MTKLSTTIRRQSPWLVLPVLVLLAVFIGWVDFVTGWELSLFIFYAVPIALAVWWKGTRAGVFLAACCALTWLTANETSHPYETGLGYAWAMLSRLFYFGVVVVAVGAVRKRHDTDAAHIRMLEERRQLEYDIVNVSEHEQQRIGRDLHDGLCQQLAAIGWAAHSLKDDLKAQNNPSAADAAMIADSIQNSVIEARNLARGIFPVHVDSQGLGVALLELARVTSNLTGVVIEVDDNDNVSISYPEMAMHLYRIAQEAVANAVRHGKAGHIHVTLDLVGRTLSLIIEDDGKGISGTKGSTREGMGLRTMHYRAQALKASLNIQPRPGGGTRVTCTLLMPESQPSASHVPH